MLARHHAEVAEERSARKAPLEESEAAALLTEVAEVLVARGRKVVTVAAGEASPADLKGPTGSFRAPIVRRGDTLLVGWNEEALERLIR